MQRKICNMQVSFSASERELLKSELTYLTYFYLNLECVCSYATARSQDSDLFPGLVVFDNNEVIL